MTFTCQRCRQPLYIDNSAAMSTYDLITHSTALAALPSPAPSSSSSAPPALSAADKYNGKGKGRASSSSSAYGLASSPAHVEPLSRVTVHKPSASTTSSSSTQLLGPGESFVVLSGEQQRALAAQQSQSQVRLHSQHHGGHASSSSSTTTPTTTTAAAIAGADGDEQEAGTHSARLAQLARLFDVLSLQTNVDQPLCSDCGEQLVRLMQRELDDAKRERDRLIAFDKDCARRAHAAVEAFPAAKGDKDEALRLSRDALRKDIVKLGKAEKHALEELASVQRERDEVEEQVRQLEKEEEELTRQERDFWEQYSDYTMQAASLRDEVHALKSRYGRDRRELARLAKANVFNDTFCIGHDAAGGSGCATINGLRLGRLPGASVDWPEINAAWGHALLLLHTVARKHTFSFASYTLVPLGSFSKVEHLDERGAVAGAYELYGSGDFAVGRLLHNRRFDLAMVAFLDCMRQMAQHLKRVLNVDVPHAIVRDKIGDVSIKLQFSSDDTWTKALRHVLLNLKVILAAT